MQFVEMGVIGLEEQGIVEVQAGSDDGSAYVYLVGLGGVESAIVVVSDLSKANNSIRFIDCGQVNLIDRLQNEVVCDLVGSLGVAIGETSVVCEGEVLDQPLILFSL